MIILKGIKVADVLRTYPKKDGTIQTVREIAINNGSELENMIVEVPVDFVLPKADANGMIMLEDAKSNSRSWDSVSKSFQYNRIRYYIESKK